MEWLASTGDRPLRNFYSVDFRPVTRDGLALLRRHDIFHSAIWEAASQHDACVGVYNFTKTIIADKLFGGTGRRELEDAEKLMMSIEFVAVPCPFPITRNGKQVYAGEAV